MVLEAERWLELRRFRALRESGATISEIARETGLNWRTVKKYLEAGPAAPPGLPPREGQRRQVITAYAPVIDAWLRAEILLKGTVVYERLVGEYGFTGNYQRVKMYLQEARPRIAAELGYTPAELARLHRRFEVVPGAQAQVDWGDEGGILAHAGIPKVYSFHMVLSYSRDPFCCFTASMDLATFFACHRRAFDHFGGYECVDHATAVWWRQEWWRSPPWSADGLDAVPGPVRRSRGSGPGSPRPSSGG